MKMKLIPLTWGNLAQYFGCKNDELSIRELGLLTSNGCSVINDRSSKTILGVWMHREMNGFDLNFSFTPREDEWQTIMKGEKWEDTLFISVPLDGLR